MQYAYDINVQADAEGAIVRHVLKYKTEDGYTPLQEDIDYLIEIIRLCKAHNVTPVLLTTPFLSEYSALAPEDFLVMQQETLDKICTAEDVVYLDFSHDRRFIGRYELFINSDHLNHNGALYFTDLLLSGALPED